MINQIPSGIEMNGTTITIGFFLLVIFLIIYFFPTFLRTRYNLPGGHFSFSLLNIFLGLTPIPWFILLLDVIDKKEHKIYFS